MIDVNTIKIGDKVVLTDPSGWTAPKGSVMTVVLDYTLTDPAKEISLYSIKQFAEDFVLHWSTIPVSPYDEVAITTTYGDLAEVYAILGGSNGMNFSTGLWQISKQILSQVIPNIKEIRDNVVVPHEVYIDYDSYQDKWIKALFNPKTKAEIQIEELEQTIAKAAAQIERLKRS